MSSLFRCTPLPLGHPCLSLPDRASNFTLPQLVQFDTVINISNIKDSYKVYTSLRGSYPDDCLNGAIHFFCIIIAPPCDPTSNGLPMQFCEQDCVTFTMLKEERTCDGLIELSRNFAGSVGSYNIDLILTLLEKFDCKTYYPFEFNNSAETCSGLLSRQNKGNDVGIKTKLSTFFFLESHSCT